MNYDTWKATDTADLSDEYRHGEDDDEALEEHLVDEWWDDPKWQLLP